MQLSERSVKNEMRIYMEFAYPKEDFNMTDRDEFASAGNALV